MPSARTPQARRAEDADAARGPRRALIVTSLAAALLALAGPALSAGIPGAVHALGTASSFSIATGGLALEGGLADWEYVCASCDLRVAVTSPDVFFAAQDGTVFAQLPPGTYDIVGFAGYASYDWQSPHVFFIELHGLGRIAQR